MVVLQEDGNIFEIKIKRVSDNTYFDERVKFGDIEETDASKADRYIVAEPGQAYAVEATVKKGLKWGKYQHVVIGIAFVGQSHAAAAAWIPRKNGEEETSEDIVETVDCVNSPFVSN